MLQLPDDCLYEIFGYLDLRHQLALTMACERFRDIILDMIWQKHWKNLNTESVCLKGFNRTEYQKFFHLIATKLIKLSIHDTSHEAFSTYLGRYMHRPELEFYLSLGFQKLIELNCYDKRMHDGYMYLVAKHCAPTLCTLRVNSRHLTGEHIHNLTHLKCLSLEHCSVNADNLLQILKHCKQLEYLNVLGNPLVFEAKHYDCIPQTRLKTLYFDGHQSIGYLIQQLPSLRVMVLEDSTGLSSLLSTMVLHRVHSLRTNSLHSSQIGEWLTQVVRHCPRLQLLICDLHLISSRENILQIIEKLPNKPKVEICALRCYEGSLKQEYVKNHALLVMDEQDEFAPNRYNKIFTRFELYDD